MPKFKKGMKVRLISHSRDSEENLDIGEKGVIIEVDYTMSQQILVKWNQSKLNQNWWVTDDIIRPINIVLENK